MKKNVLISLSLLFTSAMYAQGLRNNGAHIVITNGSNIYINGATGHFTAQSTATPGVIDNASAGGTIYVGGNWTNTNTTVTPGDFIFTGNGSTVILNGANQTINGGTTTFFYNLTLQGTGTKTLNVGTSVGGVVFPYPGVLSVGARELNLNGYALSMLNSTPAGITATSGYIISETNVALNPSIVRWYVRTNTGSYSIPFGVAGTQLPFGFNITAAMPAVTDRVDVSTRATATSANTPWASTVTHMFDPTLSQDGSDEAVIDRWWELNFTSAATANLSFAYRGSENTLQAPYNTGNLGAQWWATGWFPNNSNIGSTPAVTAGTGIATATGIAFTANTYTPMVLSSVNAPLPIQLTSFKAYCGNGNEQLIWTTASEINNDFFTIERSDDGVSFRDIGTVNGNGTSMQMHQYTFTDPQAVTTSTYYRLRQTDYNGQSSTAPLITAESCGTVSDFTDAFSSGSGIYVNIHNGAAQDYTIDVLDVQGQLVIAENVSSVSGSNQFLLQAQRLATGVYLVRVTGNDGKSFNKKVYLAAE
jgi:hypothetical protein